MARTTPGFINASSARRRPRFAKFAAMAAIALVGAASFPPGVSMAATAPGLGTAGSFAVLASSTVTNTGPTVVNGDLGVHPGLAVTGFDDPGGPGTVNGTIHAGDQTAGNAQTDAMTAYNALSDQGCDVDLANQELGGLTLTPGVYCLSSAAQLTGALTLDALGNPASVFIFRIGTALTTASDSSVVFLDDFETCNVFWQAGTSATLGTDTAFVGTVITLTEAITANTGATVTGRLLSLNAAVTLDTNTITTPVCATAATTTTTTTAATTTTTAATTTTTTAATTTTTTAATTTTTTAATTTTTAGTTTPTTVAADDTTTTVAADDTTVVTDDTTATTIEATATTDDVVGVPTTAGSSVPDLSTTVPVGVDSPSRPPLPYTGSNLVPAGFALLAIVAGGALVLVANTGRVTATRS